MYYSYKNVGKLTEDIKKTIDTVVDKCEICKKNSHSKSKPSVAVSRSTDFSGRGQNSKEMPGSWGNGG